MPNWKPIPGFEAYEASDAGEVRSIISGRTLATVGRGRAMRYRAVDLHPPDGRRWQAYVHHVVLLTFVGPRPEGCQALHLNDVPTDNRLENLRWGTHQENTDMRKHACGEKQSDAIRRGWLTRRAKQLSAA